MKRLVATIGLLIVGGGLLVYGVGWHGVTVYVEQQREVSILVPSVTGGFGAQTPEMPGPPAAGGPTGEASPFEASGGEQNPFESSATAENPFQPSTSGSEPDLGAMPGGLERKTIREKILVAQQEPEWKVVREVTVGGLVLLADGMLKRTYSGRPPSLCPT